MTALEAFLGEGLVYVKVKNLGRIVIDFACIKIPHYMVGDVEMVEKVYDCIIKQDESHTIITPKFVREYPFLSTDDDELLRKLKDWFTRNSKNVIADLLKSKKGEN
jgi:hypothetical protein